MRYTSIHIYCNAMSPTKGNIKYFTRSHSGIEYRTTYFEINVYTNNSEPRIVFTDYQRVALRVADKLRFQIDLQDIHEHE